MLSENLYWRDFMKQRTRADWLSLFESHAQSGLTASAIEAGSVRLQVGAVQISLHGASPDYVASLLQKLQ